MQIHEITCRKLDEGILGDIGRGVFQGATGMEIPQSQASINKDAASAAAKAAAATEAFEVQALADAVAAAAAGAAGGQPQCADA